MSRSFYTDQENITVYLSRIRSESLAVCQVAERVEDAADDMAEEWDLDGYPDDARDAMETARLMLEVQAWAEQVKKQALAFERRIRKGL